MQLTLNPKKKRRKPTTLLMQQDWGWLNRSSKYLSMRKDLLILRISTAGLQFIRHAFKGHIAVVKELVQNGADVNLQTNDGNTPILLAAWKGKSSVVQYLLENNADSTAKNE